MKRNTKLGFTLVEVAIAIGISSFVMMAILGALQVGLSNFRGAVDRSAHARISQQLMEEVSMSDFSNLVSQSYIASFPRFFTEEGVPVEGGNSRAIYRVQVTRAYNGMVLSSGTADSVGRLPSGVEEKDLARVLFQLGWVTDRYKPSSVMVTASDNGR